ncbi:MAG: phosphotransferase family protein [Phycisphaerae bacterium]
MNLDTPKAVELVKAHLGEGPWDVKPFGAGKFSQTFSADSDGGQYVLRVAPPDSVLQLFYEFRMMRQEPGIHQRLLAETHVPVPPIVAADFSRQRIDRDYVLMPRLPGSPLSEASLDAPARDRALREWGGYIAQAHELTAPHNRFGYLGEHECMPPQESWMAAFGVMYTKLIHDCIRCGVYDRTTGDEAIELLTGHLHAFGHCRRSHLLHGDIWVTNLLVQPDGKVTGVIDWDRACWGDIEWDLAIAEYCGVTRRPFWEGYGREVDTHSGEAALRRMFYLLYEHQKYIVISVSSRRDDPRRARRYARESLEIMDRFRETGIPQF